MTEQQAPRPQPEPEPCRHQWHPFTRDDVPDGQAVRTCAFCGRPNWDDIDALIEAAAADAVHDITEDARSLTKARITLDQIALAPDNTWLHARIGRPVIVRNPTDRDMWQGTLHAIHDEPTVVIDQGCGQRVTLPQALEIEDAPPPEIGDVDDRLLWVLHRAMDEWGPAGVADVAARMAGRPT